MSYVTLNYSWNTPSGTSVKKLNSPSLSNMHFSDFPFFLYHLNCCLRDTGLGSISGYKQKRWIGLHRYLSWVVFVLGMDWVRWVQFAASLWLSTVICGKTYVLNKIIWEVKRYLSEDYLLLLVKIARFLCL